MKEVLNINNLTVSEAVEIDLKFRRCAALAIAPFDEKKKSGTLGDDYIFNCMPWLAACFSNANFRDRCTDVNAVMGKFETIIGKMDTEKEKHRLKIALPILFYNLILNNEFNSAKLRQQNNRNKSHVRKNMMLAEGWGKQNPYIIERAIANDSNLKTGYVKKFNDAVDAVENKDVFWEESEVDVLQSSLLAINYDKDWNNEIVYRKESAQIGYFLRNLLSLDELKQFDATPIDTLLRMYIFNSIDGIFYRTCKQGQLLEEYDNKHTQNMLITKAVNLLQPKPQRNIICNWLEAVAALFENALKPEAERSSQADLEKTAMDEFIIYQQNDIRFRLNNLPQEIVRPTDSFKQTYWDLVKTYDINESFVKTLADIYLDPDVLDHTPALTGKVRAYINNSLKKINGSPQKQKSVDELSLNLIGQVARHTLMDQIEEFVITTQNTFKCKYLKCKDQERRYRLAKNISSNKYILSKKSRHFKWMPIACRYCLRGMECVGCSYKENSSKERLPCPQEVILERIIEKYCE